MVAYPEATLWDCRTSTSHAEHRLLVGGLKLGLMVCARELGRPSGTGFSRAGLDYPGFRLTGLPENEFSYTRLWWAPLSRLPAETYRSALESAQWLIALARTRRRR